MGVFALSRRRGRRSSGEPRSRHEIKCLCGFLLDRRQRLSIRRECKCLVAVCVLGDPAKFPTGPGDESNLQMVRGRTAARHIGGEKTAPVRQPHETAKIPIIELRKWPHFAGDAIRELNQAERAVRVEKERGDLSSVRGPRNQCRLIHRTGSVVQCARIRSIRIRCKYPKLSHVRIVRSREHDALAFRREAYTAADVMEHGLRRASQNRGAVEIEGALGSISKVDVIAVGRENQIPVISIRRRDHLRITICRNVMEPKALLAFVFDHAEQVLAVGRNGRANGLPVIGDLGDGEICERSGVRSMEQSIEAVSRSGQKNDRDQDTRGQAELVSPRNSRDRRAARQCLSRGN